MTDMIFKYFKKEQEPTPTPRKSEYDRACEAWENRFGTKSMREWDKARESFIDGWIAAKAGMSLEEVKTEFCAESTNYFVIKGWCQAKAEGRMFI